MQNINPSTKKRYIIGANNSNIAACFEIKSEKRFTHKTLSSTKKCRSFTWAVSAANTLPCAHVKMPEY